MQINYGLINIPTVGSHNEINVHYHSTVSDAQLLREILRPLQSMAMQPNNAPLASLGIEGLQKKYLENLQKDREIKDALAMYVSPECTAITDTEKRFSLEEKVRDFLASEEKKVLLLLGVAGSGKSTFNRFLARSLWEGYDKEANKSGQTPIPLFISLSSLKEPNANLISEYLKKEKFTEDQIADLKANYRFIFILDGYDEIKDRTRLFYAENELDEWQAKVIVTSRPEYLGGRYERQFHPKDQAYLLQTYQLAPFSDLSIEEYVNKYKSIYSELEKSIAEHGKILERPEVKELIRNPFLLKLSLSELPALALKYKDSSQRITRLALYEQFVESWFERSQDRLSGIRLTDAEQKAFHFLNKAFIKHGTKFSQDLAIEMYQAGLVRVTYSELLSYDESNVKQDWRDKFFSDSNEKIKLLRFNAPLTCRDDQFEFIHKSIQDYLVARIVWQELEESTGSDATASEQLNGMKNVQALWKALNDTGRVDPKGLLNRFNLVEDAAIQQFLVERVQQNRALEKPLLAWIQASKQTDSVSQGSSNAITILVKAGLQLNGLDLQGIRIPGADLSFGMLDLAQLQGSDLSGANLRAIWLRGANLNGAQMAGVQFGEWAYIQEESEVNSCAYSPDGKTCAMGLGNGKIRLYDTSSWAKIHTLEGHIWGVQSVVYSPSGTQIASGGLDKTVRLWDAQSGAAVHTLEGHTDRVASVVYSPIGSHIASGSWDHTVRLWDAQSGAAVHTLEGHTDGVLSVAYSPSGSQIASGSLDKTVRLWDAQSGAAVHTLEGHTGYVNSVVYSPIGSHIASGSWDHTVRLWDAQSGAAGHTLGGHTGYVNSVVYSPSGMQIASGSLDKTVRLWDAQSGAAVHTLEGHIGYVWSVVYSPSGSQIASGSYDQTVRLWDAHSGAAVHTLEGHTGSVQSVVYSPSGTQIASGSDDKTVRLWDAHSGAAVHTLEGHTWGVNSVVYSPSGTQIASGSWDHTVRLWDAQSGAAGPTLEGHTGSVKSVVYSPSGTQIASGSYDQTVRLWDAHSGAAGHTLEGHTDSVNSVVYSPSGTQIASGSDDKTVRLWDVHSGAAVHTLEGHTDSVNSVMYSPSGTQIVSGSYDHTVRLWDAHSGAAVHTLEGHTSSVNSVVYSPIDTQIASGSEDHTVRLWEVSSGVCLRVIQAFTGPVLSVAWTERDGHQYLVTGSLDKSVRHWELQKEAEGYKLKLNWSSGHGALSVADMLLEGVEGLSEMNVRLLRQRGALESRGRRAVGE
ncbi:NB-ARC domain protein [Mycoavidus cysteinexigens]|uniref:NB-ARC domain protein n=3 Tax=Mycoavidus cysteinexigens TaxID=1553431 RepID=A0A2Z6EW79_9BURK|nr:NB-ARC domain protein [Mycoavidus cysteinexigens]